MHASARSLLLSTSGRLPLPQITYLGEGRPERLFNPTPGMWFTNQSEEVRGWRRRKTKRQRHARGDRCVRAHCTAQVLAALHAAFERDPYPPPAEVERLAKQVRSMRGERLRELESFLRPHASRHLLQVGAPSPAQVETFYANMRLLSNA